MQCSDSLWVPKSENCPIMGIYVGTSAPSTQAFWQSLTLTSTASLYYTKTPNITITPLMDLNVSVTGHFCWNEGQETLKIPVFALQNSQIGPTQLCRYDTRFTVLDTMPETDFYTANFLLNYPPNSFSSSVNYSLGIRNALEWSTYCDSSSYDLNYVISLLRLDPIFDLAWIIFYASGPIAVLVGMLYPLITICRRCCAPKDSVVAPTQANKTSRHEEFKKTTLSLFCLGFSTFLKFGMLALVLYAIINMRKAKNLIASMQYNGCVDTSTALIDTSKLLPVVS